MQKQLDVMARTAPEKWGGWRDKTKGEFAEALEHFIIKPIREDDVHSFEDLFHNDTLCVDPRNITEATLATAAMPLYEKLERYPAAVNMAENQPGQWKRLYTVLLKLMVFGYYTKENTADGKMGEKAKYSEGTRALREKSGMALKGRVETAKGAPGHISTAVGLVDAWQIEMLSLQNLYKSHEKLFVERVLVDQSKGNNPA